MSQTLLEALTLTCIPHFQAPFMSPSTITTKPVPSYYGKQGSSTLLEHPNAFCLTFMHIHPERIGEQSGLQCLAQKVLGLQIGAAREQTTNFQLVDDLLHHLGYSQVLSAL